MEISAYYQATRREEKQYLCSEFGKVVIIYQQQAEKSSTFAAKMKKWLSLTNGIRKEAVPLHLLQKIIKNLIVEIVKN